MRNFNTISIFQGANALQFLGGGNSQNEVRKTEGKQPRNRQRISNLSLTLVSTFVRYAVCIALLLCLGVGQMWGTTYYVIPAKCNVSAGALVAGADGSTQLFKTDESTVTVNTDISSSLTGTAGFYYNSTSTTYANLTKISNYGTSSSSYRTMRGIKVEASTNCTITVNTKRFSKLDVIYRCASSDAGKTLTIDGQSCTPGDANVHLMSITKDYSSNIIISNGSNKEFDIFVILTESTASCTAPNHVDVSGRWDRFGGETIELTATAYSSAGTGSPISSGVTYQWQKWYNSQWNDIDGATSATYTKTNCDKDDSGSYRCVASTGTGCETASDGFQVKVYVLECYTGGTTVYNFTRTGSSQAGTLTIDLSASTAYTFKVHADNDYYGNNGTINEDVTNWVLCNNSNVACTTNLTVNSGLGGTFTFSMEYSTSGSSSVEGEPEISVTYPRKRIYLDPGVWNTGGAKFAYYYHRDGGSTGWTGFLTDDDCGMYADIPQWNGVEINPVRLKNTTESPNWDDKWNQTSDITVTSNDYVQITNWGSGDSPYDYGTYSMPTYTISYNKGSTTHTGGNSISGSKDNETKTCGTDFTLPSSVVFTTTGYTQTGWATEDGGSKAYNLGDDYTTNAAQTFYPAWTVQSFTLTWDLQGGTVTTAGTGAAKDATGTPSSSVDYGTSLTAPSVSKTGYNFSAWSPTVASTMPASNTTYTATWTAKTTSITLDKNNSDESGTANGSATATYDSGTITDYEPATRTGYHLTKYQDEDDHIIIKNDGTLNTGDKGDLIKSSVWAYEGSSVTLYAQWEANQYNINYYDAGATDNIAFSGSHADGYPTKHTYGSSTTLKSATKTGYTFGGWYNNYSCTGDAVTSIGATAITANIKLYAKWTINTHTLTWDFADGSSDETAGEDYTAGGSINYGTSINYPSNGSMSKSGYVFSGWSTDASTMPDENLTITAQWTRVYTVTYNYNGATSGATPASATAASVTLPNPTRTDYVFDGWYTTDGEKVDDGGETYSPTADITLYARWEAECEASGGSSTLFDVDFTDETTEQIKAATSGASWVAKTYDTYNMSFGSKDADAGVIDIINGTGLQFTGNNMNNYNCLAIPLSLTKDKKVTAVVTLGDETKIKYNWVSGSLPAPPSNGSTGSTYSTNSKTNTLEYTPASSGDYVLYLGRSGSSSGKVVESVVITQEGGGSGTCYHVYYHGNGAESGFVSDTTSYAEDEDPVVLDYDASRYPLTKDGYTFQGWATIDDGDVEYAAGENIEDIDDDVDLYAVWAETVEEYTISFEGNGSTGGSTASVTNITSGSDVSQITANGFTKNGCTFAGWKTNTALTYVAYGDEDDGTNEVSAAVNDIVPDKARIKNVTSDITLTAQWTPKTYTITYIEGSDKTTVIDGLSPTSYTFNAGKVTLPTPAARACYTFDGWYKSSCVDTDHSGEFHSDCKRTEISNGAWGEYTFYGKWTLNSHTLTWNFNGGSTSDDYTAGGDVNCGTSLTYPTLSKTGYTFSSWSSDATEMPDEDLTITASWTANTYSVTLDPDNGSPTSTVTATYDADMPAKLSDGKTAVAVPTFSGYTFGGYYDNHAGAGKQYYTNAVASANTWDKASTATLYAKWTQTVTLKTGSQGSGDDLTPTVLYKGTAISGFTTGHTAYGYKLLGYYTASSDGTKVLDADGTFAASNMTDYITDGKWTKTSATTLYAQWEDMTVELPGTLDKANNIETGGGLTFINDTLDYSHGDNNHRDGYAEWKVNVAQKCVYTVTINGNYTSTGRQWEMYLVNGSGTTISTCTFDAKYDTGDQSYTKNWDLSGIAATGTYIVRLKNTLEWGAGKVLSVAIDPIKVTYNANGGTCATEYAYYAGSALTLPTPTRDGYVFEGWYNGATKVGNAGGSYSPTASITLTAKWAPIIDLPGTLNKANMETYGEGLTFRNDTLDYGTGSNHHRDGYADWKVNVEKCVYIVTTDGYYPNGHQWKVYLISGSDTLSTCVFDNNNSTGLYTETKQWDLSGITSAGVYTIRMRNIRDWGEPRLKSVTISPITVTYDANGGSCATESAVYGGSALTLPTPTWSGYTFEGWYNAGVKVGDADDEYTPTEDITLYAYWTDNISGKVFSYIDNNYGDKFKAFDLSDWVSSDQTGKDKTYTNGTTGVKFVVDDGAWDNKSNSISALAKYKNGSTKDSIIIPTGKIATVKISYGAYYDTEKKKNYGPLTIGGSPQTAVTTVLDDGMTNAQVDAALKEITLSNQQDTLILGSDHDNIFIGRVSAVITGYVITYATGDYGSGDSFTATKTAGSSYTISSTDNAFTRTNCVYDGWSVNADGSTKDYAFGASYTTDAPLTLYPHWVATCATPDDPTGFSAGSITDEGVTFTITDAGDAGNYDIYYSTTSTAPTSSTDATTTATTKTPEITGLSEGTTYYAWVRAVCDEDHKSSWVALNPGGDTHTFFTHYTVTMGTVTTRQHDGETVGGTISSDVSHAAEGDEVTLTATPTSGYAFVSWTIEKTSDNSDVTSTVLSGDNTLMMPAYGVTVKATFAEQFTIVYKDEDKTTTLDGLEPTFYLYGIGVPTLPTPTKTGYTFDSWYNAWCVDSKNEGSWEDECRKSSIGTTDYSNATYYAKWTAIDYTVTHSDAENGTYTIQVDDASATDETTTANIGQTITLSATPSSGYALSAWNVTSGGDPIDVVDGEFTMPAADVTIAPTFGVVYTVTFNTNGGSTVDAIEQDAPGAAIAMPDAPTKSGYDFVNWMIGGTTKAAGASYTPTANVTAYATWKAECAADDPVLAIGASEATTSSFLGEYSSEGITISSDRSWVSDKSCDGAVQLESSGTYNTNYLEVLASSYNISKVSFLLTGNGDNKEIQPVVFGWATTASSTAATYGMLDARTITSKKYINAEWFTYDFSESSVKCIHIYKNTKNISSTSPEYTGSSTAFGGSNTIWIYGIKVWLDDGSGTCYYVTYDGNGATSGYVNDPVAHTAGDNVTVASNYSGFTRTGYEFNGWNTAADGSGTQYNYWDIDHNKIEDIAANITLYAQWKMVISSDNIDFDGYDDPTAYKDVVVTNGAMLTITKNTIVRDITIETGSTLNVNTANGDGTGDGITLTANSLSLVGGWGRIRGETKYDMPRVYIAPASTLTKTVSTVNLDVAMDNRNYYPIAVPFPVDVKDIDYENSTLKYYSVYGLSGQYAIKKYNGQSRANRGSNHANWEVMDDGVIYGSTTETLQPGLGYIMTALPAPGFGEYAVMRFPMEVDNAWTDGGEKGSATISAETVTKNVVAVEAYVKEEGETPKANKGWNLLGIPFMSCYQTSEDMYSDEGAATIIQGRFDYTTNKFDDEDEIRYVSVPTHDFSEYLQYNIVDDDTKLMPGWCFFVQVETSGNLTYLSAQEAADSDLPIYAPKREKKALPTEKTGIFLSGANASDKTTILVSDKYSATEYEINADLEKLFGEDSYTLATYSLMGTTRLAYNAMSNADIANVIPIGYRAPEEGEYTFSINPRYAESAFERVDLIDYETGFVTNLLMSSYTFTSERTQSDARFAINVVKRKEVPTDIENGADGADDAEKVRKMIIDNKMYIILNGRMYDATGKMVK